MGWEKGLLHEMCLHMQSYLPVLHVTEFMRYVWLGPWSQVTPLYLGKEERLQNSRCQHRCGQREVRGNNLKLVLQWIHWENFGALSSPKQKFGPLM